MRSGLTIICVGLFAGLSVLGGGTKTTAAAGRPQATSTASASSIYLPVIARSIYCDTGTTYVYGPVYQRDGDNPVRPAWNHADKNLALRSFAIDNSLSDPQKQIQALYPASDPNAPNLFELFGDNRVPTVLNVYDVYDWNWAASPDPGTRSSNFVSTSWPITVLGVQVTPGEVIRTPASGYDLGQNVTAIVVYADSRRITLVYTRDDSVATGYAVHLENLCVDQGLLALYNSLDNAARNTYYGPPDSIPDYNLVTLTAHQPIGVAIESEMQIVIRDRGGFMDPRSYNDWWH